MKVLRCVSFTITFGFILLSAGRTFALTVEDVMLRVEKRLAEFEASVTHLRAENEVLKHRIEELEASSLPKGVVGTIIKYVPEPLNDVNGPHIIIEGANLHVRSGSGATNDSHAPIGLGNVFIGYNEARSPYTVGRGGSHNLVIGARHQYSSVGGLVAGFENKVSGVYSTVSGGRNNLASGSCSSVSGGGDEVHSAGNVAGGKLSSISGGCGNEAGGDQSSIGGGVDNIASGVAAYASGGWDNTAGGYRSSVTGGYLNRAWGQESSVSGGMNRSANGGYDWVGGGLFEEY